MVYVGSCVNEETRDDRSVLLQVLLGIVIVGGGEGVYEITDRVGQ